MTAITDDCTYHKRVNGPWIEVLVLTPTTAVSADTVVLKLSDYGIKTFEAIFGAVQTTENSVVATEAPTTAVSSGSLTVTVGGTLVTAKRAFTILGL
ncbi:MAG: hypothetical protein WC307_05230 [Candidatus Nanoarchaeia archaeon]|jgi:hypothetical protein